MPIGEATDVDAGLGITAQQKKRFGILQYAFFIQLLQRVHQLTGLRFLHLDESYRRGVNKIYKTGFFSGS